VRFFDMPPMMDAKQPSNLDERPYTSFLKIGVRCWMGNPFLKFLKKEVLFKSEE